MDKLNKGEWSRAKASEVRASGMCEAMASKVRLKGKEQEKSDQQSFPLSSSPKLLQFFYWSNQGWHKIQNLKKSKKSGFF